MNINLAQVSDLNAIQRVAEIAFSDEESHTMSNLTFYLFTETANPEIKSLVVQVDYKIIGKVFFSLIFLESETGVFGYIVAPFAVSL